MKLIVVSNKRKFTFSKYLVSTDETKMFIKTYILFCITITSFSIDQIQNRKISLQFPWFNTECMDQQRKHCLSRYFATPSTDVSQGCNNGMSRDLTQKFPAVRPSHVLLFVRLYIPVHSFGTYTIYADCDVFQRRRIEKCSIPQRETFHTRSFSSLRV